MESNTKERIDSETPKIIRDLFLTPYRYFSYDAWQNGYKTAIDFGCGNGDGTSIMEKFFDNVVGVDKEIIPFKNFLQLDVTNAKCIEDKSFDIVFCFEVIEHLDAVDQPKLLNEIDRISKNGFVIGSVNKDGPSFIEGVEIYKGERNPYHLHELNTNDFLDIADKFKSRNYKVDVYGSFYYKNISTFIINRLVNKDYQEEIKKPLCNYLKVIKSK